MPGQILYVDSMLLQTFSKVPWFSQVCQLSFCCFDSWEISCQHSSLAPNSGYINKPVKAPLRDSVREFWGPTTIHIFNLKNFLDAFTLRITEMHGLDSHHCVKPAMSSRQFISFLTSPKSLLLSPNHQPINLPNTCWLWDNSLKTPSHLTQSLTRLGEHFPCKWVP